MTEKQIEALIHEIVEAAEDYDSEFGGFISEGSLMEKLRECLPVLYAKGFEDGRTAALLPRA